jgi:hypothetical protein
MPPPLSERRYLSQRLEGLFPMRDAKRFEIRCPVTVQVSNGQKHKVNVQGVLYDIGVDGARVALEQPVPPGTKISLFAHFRDPEEQVTTIRFEGIVQRLQEEPRFQIAVDFQGTGRFLQKQIVDLRTLKVAGADDASRKRLPAAFTK